MKTIIRVCAVLLGMVALQAMAQSYPVKPVKMIVPFPAGGTTDILGRIVAQKLSERLGQPFIIDNRGGAGGNIGADMVAKSTPDGYTLLVGTVGTNAINASLYAKMPYDTAKDFVPIGLIAAVPNVLVVHPSLPARSVKELIDLLKSKPGEINFASSGNGTSIHLSGELFKTMAGVRMNHIPYKGSAPALTDLIGGQVQLMFDNLPSSMPHIKAGRLRALAVTSLKRSAALPDLPTIAEAALPGFDASSWFALFAPAGTPKAIVVKLNSELNAILQLADVREKFAAQGAEPTEFNPEQFAAFTQAELTKWARVVKESGAKVD
jgi:tripartite-type tricarboxylate transporter receptor subunit TctC